MKPTFVKLSPNAIIPKRQTAQSSGFDLHSSKSMFMHPGERKLINTSVAIRLPPGLEAQVRSRSGLAAKKGIMVLNSPGTIDSDYTGELMVILYNAGEQSFTVTAGDRIAQLVIAPVYLGEVDESQGNECTENTEETTTRGAQGFGSTGV